MDADTGTVESVESFNCTDTGGRVMNIAAFYCVACVFMCISAVLSGIQWSEANGVREYISLVLRDRPVILLVTVVIFILSGVMMQIGKHHFELTYYEISIIWLATSWVSLLTLWLVHNIKPSWPELVGIIFCHMGLAISTIARLQVRA